MTGIPGVPEEIRCGKKLQAASNKAQAMDAECAPLLNVISHRFTDY